MDAKPNVYDMLAQQHKAKIDKSSAIPNRIQHNTRELQTMESAIRRLSTYEQKKLALSKMVVYDLKHLCDEMCVDYSGLRRKTDFVDALIVPLTRTTEYQEEAWLITMRRNKIASKGEINESNPPHQYSVPSQTPSDPTCYDDLWDEMDKAFNSWN